ncbi:MAG: hypothetical protein LBV43_07355 [Prevotella sp.]|jgi:hypothetical protein|nr:hypothetical protein [Prevotella sp.]
MKKIKLLLLILLILPAFTSYADIIIDQYPVKVYVKIDNVEEFSDIIIIGVSNCPVFSKKPFIVNSDSEMEIRKTCSIKFYAVKKDYLEEKGLDNIKWGKDKNVLKANETIKIKRTISDEPNECQEIHFTIAGFNDKEMVIYKSSQVYKYGNSHRPDKVEKFDYTGDRSKLKNNF